MNILFLTRQINVCLRITSILESNGHKVKIFQKDDEFYEYVSKSNGREIDLLCIDFKTIGMPKSKYIDLKPYSFLKAARLAVPLISYNDPNCELDMLVYYWKMRNAEEFPEIFNMDFLEKYTGVFTEIQEIVSSDELNPYISCICRPLPCSSQGDFDLCAFRKKHSMILSRFKLFKYFFENLDKILSVKEICSHLWGIVKEEKKKTLYTYIYYLRKIFEKEEVFNFSLEREGTESYRLLFKGRKVSSQL